MGASSPPATLDHLCLVRLEASASQRSPPHSEAPRPSVHLERSHGAADRRHAQCVMATGGPRVWQLKARTSGDLHHVYVVRRRRLSREARYRKVWTPPTRIAPRLLWCPRLHAPVPCCHGFGSIRLDDVGHAATGCTAVAVVVSSPQQHVMASFTGGFGALLLQHHRRGSCGDERPAGEQLGRPPRARVCA